MELVKTSSTFSIHFFTIEHCLRWPPSTMYIVPCTWPVYFRFIIQTSDNHQMKSYKNLSIDVHYSAVRRQCLRFRRRIPVPSPTTYWRMKSLYGSLEVYWFTWSCSLQSAGLYVEFNFIQSEHDSKKIMNTKKRKTL